MTYKEKPIYLLARGKRNDHNTLDRLLQNVFKDSGVSSPSIAYIGTANRDDSFFFQRIANRFKKAGSNKVTHVLITSDKADLGKAQDILRSADIIFVSGGDVEEGMRILEEKNMVIFLRRLYETVNPSLVFPLGVLCCPRNGFVGEIQPMIQPHIFSLVWASLQ